MFEPKSKEREEKVVFHKQIVIELVEKEYHSEYANMWFRDRYAEVDGESVTLNDRSFDNILMSIKRKVDILSDLRRDQTYEALKKEILADIAHLIFKLEQGEHA